VYNQKVVGISKAHTWGFDSRIYDTCTESGRIYMERHPSTQRVAAEYSITDPIVSVEVGGASGHAQRRGARTALHKEKLLFQVALSGGMSGGAIFNGNG
jgi:hypothetical protein